MAAIAAVFWPITLVATSIASCVRLVATTSGGTVIANAASKALAAAEAWAAVCSACAPVVLIQVMYGSTAAAIVADVGPSHSPSKTSIVDWYWVAADSSSAASRFHAAEAARIGAEPGPEYILPELISGGNAPKSMVSVPN